MKTESIELPQPFLDCLQSWGALRAELMPTAPDAVAYIDEKLASAAWAWEPKVKPIAPAKFDRTGESLRSPVFSSEQHPWPELDGSPMLPVLQLNLAQASQKAGIALGDGLLQMFVSVADSLGRRPEFRVVPLADVLGAKLTAIPVFKRVKMPFVSMEWACSEFDEDDDDTQALQIVSYGKPKFTLQTMDKLDGVADTSDAEDPTLRKRVKALDGSIKKWASKWSASGFHLFGTFDSIQYKASQRPRPLFCLESGEFGFNFGDGNGQLFFKLNEKGEPQFSFDWSCY